MSLTDETAQIALFTAPIPSGWAVSITLEALGIPYSVRPIDRSGGDHHTPGYLAISPAGDVPAIIDRTVTPTTARERELGGLPVVGAAAIQVHLATTRGRLLPSEPGARSRVLHWLTAQPDAGAGARARWLAALDARLEQHDFLEGDFSIADIALFSRLRDADATGLDHLERWRTTIGARQAVVRGSMVPTPIDLPDVLDHPDDPGKRLA